MTSSPGKKYQPATAVNNKMARKRVTLLYTRLCPVIIRETYFLLLFDKIPWRLCIFCSCTSRDLSFTFCNLSIIASKNGIYFCISANFLSYSSILFSVYRSPVSGEENIYTYISLNYSDCFQFFIKYIRMFTTDISIITYPETA